MLRNKLFLLPIPIGIHHWTVGDISIEIYVICCSDRIWTQESTHTWVIVSGSVVCESCFYVVLSASVESRITYCGRICSIYWLKSTTLSFSIRLSEERVGILVYNILVFVRDTDDTSEVVFLIVVVL